MKNDVAGSILGLLLMAAPLCFLAGASGAVAAPSKSQAGMDRSQKSAWASQADHPVLDTAAVRKRYLDGDFDQAIEILEAGLKERRPFNHGDSVFIFKHLGVMYAAKYETRKKGKYYMHQLLMTEPTAKIMDMYASDMIYMIFKNIQDEFESNRMRLTHAETLVNGNARPEPEPKTAPIPASKNRPRPTGKEPEPKRSSHALLWVGASGVAVAAGVAAFFLLSEKPATVTTDHPVQ